MRGVFEKIIDRFVDQQNENRHESHNDEWNVGLDQAEQIVNQVVAEYNNGWIPVSKSIPTKEEYLKNDGRFIVTDGNRRYQGWFDIYDGHFAKPSRNDIMSEDKCVIAWQTLPEPYKPKKN